MQEPLVYLLDDDAAVRDSLTLLIRSIGLKVVAYSSPKEFLDNYDSKEVGCLVLDIRMPSMSGLAVQNTIGTKGWDIPIIFITGHGDTSQCRSAFKAGAADFLMKPIDEHTLLDSLQNAIQKNIASHQHKQAQKSAHTKFACLSKREREVCELIVVGLPNKQIANKLSVALRTVENHRAAVFQKLGANSLAELVRMSIVIEMPEAKYR